MFHLLKNFQTFQTHEIHALNLTYIVIVCMKHRLMGLPYDIVYSER